MGIMIHSTEFPGDSLLQGFLLTVAFSKARLNYTCWDFGAWHIYTFGILYAIPLIIGFVLSAVGFLLSRRKKQKLLAQLRTYPPKAVAMFEELLVRFPADTSEDRFSDEDWERWKQEEKEKAYEKMMEAWDWD